MDCQKVSHILPEKHHILPEKCHILMALICDAFLAKCDAYPSKCDPFPLKYVTPSGNPLALEILNNFKSSHYQKKVEKNKNTIKISEFDSTCRENLVFGAIVPSTY